MGYGQIDLSGVDMMGLQEPQPAVHISYPREICQNSGEKTDQYQSFLQVANALATEMKFFSSDYNQSLKIVEGQLYQNLDFDPDASVWDMITGEAGQGIPADQAYPVQNTPLQMDASFQAAISNFNWNAIKDIGSGQTYDEIINGNNGANLTAFLNNDPTGENSFDLMCSMLDAKEKVFGAFQSIFGSADSLNDPAKVIDNINAFLDKYKTIDPHNMSLINLFFSLQGRFMAALSQFSTNSAFMTKVSNYISTLSGTKQDAANVLLNEWTGDMRRWDLVNKTSVNCNPAAFQLLIAPLNLDAPYLSQVLAAYTAANGDLSSFSDALDAIKTPSALTDDQKAALEKAFSSAKKTFLQELHTQLLKVIGLSAAQESQVVQAYEDSNGDPTLFGGLLNSIVPPLTSAQIAAVQAALVTAENNYTAFDPDFTVGTNWFDYFHYEMTAIGNKDAVRSLTGDMYNHYVDNKYNHDESDYQDKKDDRIDDEIALMKLEAKHRAEAKAAMNALLKRKSSPSKVSAAKSAKGSSSKNKVSAGKRMPTVAATAGHSVVSAPAARHAQSAATAAGFAARNLSAAAIAAGASNKARGSSSSPSTQAVEAQAKRHQKDDKKVI